ncbi:MAG: Virginiamycin B lyase [Candidatus Tumulicola sp.]
MRLLKTVRFGASALLVAGLLTACGKGTPLTSGTATPPPPFNPSVTSEYPIPTASSQPAGVALGSDGNIWFTELGKSKIGQLNQQAKIAEAVTPTAKAGPNGIASGPNSRVWFTETNVAKIGQILLTGPTFTDSQLPNAAARPVGIALGSDGNMWVTDPGTNAIWKVPQKGKATACPLSPNAQPLGITNGPDGAIWFTEPGINSIGRLPVGSKCSALTEFKIPTAKASPAGIAAGTDNALWFTERGSRKLGRIAVTGQVTNEYALAPAQGPNALIEGIDGNFYFTDTPGDQIGQFLTRNQKVTLFKVPTANAQPTAMTLGPDEQVYFTEAGGNHIGQFKYF